MSVKVLHYQLYGRNSVLQICYSSSLSHIIIFLDGHCNNISISFKRWEIEIWGKLMHIIRYVHALSYVWTSQTSFTLIFVWVCFFLVKPMYNVMSPSSIIAMCSAHFSMYMYTDQKDQECFCLSSWICRWIKVRGSNLWGWKGYQLACVICSR